MQKVQNYETIDKKYLIKQNRKLRMQLKQLKQIGAMHKNALIVISDPKTSTNTLLKTLLNIIKKNSQAKKLQQMKKENGQLDSKLLVLQKIMQQAIQSQKQTYHLLVDQFQALKEDNMKKDDQLNKFYQKIGEVDYLSGLVTKYIQVISPSQQAAAFQKQQTQLLDMLNMQKDSIKKLQEQKQKLVKINVHLKDQLDKRKEEVKNMSLMILQPYIEAHINANQPNQNNMILQDLQKDVIQQKNNQKLEQRSLDLGHLQKNLMINHNNANVINQSLINVANLNQSLLNMSVGHNPNNNSVLSAINFIKLQNQLIREDDNGDDSSDAGMSDCPQMATLFPDKVQKIRSNKQKKKVPYLNMLKVRELMVQRQSKIKKEMQAANANINPTTKIIKLQGQLQITRKELSNNMLKLRTLNDQNKQMNAHIQQLEARNHLLLQANERLTKIYKSLFQEYQFCRAVTVQIQSLLGQKLRGQNINIINQRIQQCFNPHFKFKKTQQKQILQGNKQNSFNGISNGANMQNSKLQMNQHITAILLKKNKPKAIHKRALSK